ncbi:cytochrome c biogenesis protein ResB [Cytobacillus firmus]|jgi:cytochrome c biogenesis protein|uniref:cytochrome c biogenesis protein ResB n=1 Tax=Paenibacillus lautus TaxID=1401 RepID=UPI0010F41248|nr:cytochrome c biogenesis protein ResB [Paenibacillus lautus]MBY0160411.1 cytochrome c biogenesis protein ResB [Cytobacillus firmus]MCI1774847.1 cytochrome c biogenesis protein ResB [Paenibacillus lautus]VTR62369.1 Cytochrome c biogenesis protein CcsB [Actinobacillus pleuropneumoniae]
MSQGSKPLIQNTKCDCGHQNPTGTVLCEACGKPLTEEAEAQPILEMRYDGVARRSQKENPGIIDRVWNFFSSVKVAIYLILLTLIGSSLGTIFPQESTFLNIDPSVYYKEEYGQLGHIYYLLGLSHTYTSWWFVLLLVMIGASLVICSLDRVLPLYKALSRQRIPKHMSFLTRQKVVYQGQVQEDGADWVERIKPIIKKKGYRVRTDGGTLLAEKQRFSRWGPYVLHIGLIIFLLAVLGRNLPGLHMDEHMAFPQGEPVHIKNTSYYLLNDGFKVEFYTEDDMPEEFKGKNKVLPKEFQTQAILYMCEANCDDLDKEPELVELTRHNIEVNHPLNYKGLKAYQFDYDLTPILRTVSPVLIDSKSGKEYGKITLSIDDPQREYQAGEYTLTLTQSFTDFGLGDNGKPVNLSPNPNAPAFLFLIKGPDLPKEGVQYFYFPKQIDKERFNQEAINAQLAGGEALVKLDVLSMDDVDFSESTTYLNIRVDKAMPFIWVGCFIGMIGLVMGFYFTHRRIWLRIDNGTLTLGAHTNKNWFGLRKEISAILKQMNIEVDEKSLENNRGTKHESN